MNSAAQCFSFLCFQRFVCRRPARWRLTTTDCGELWADSLFAMPAPDSSRGGQYEQQGNLRRKLKMKIEMRLAGMEDAPLCAGFIDEARKYQHEQGFVQWTEEYPNLNTIIDDINARRGYILTGDNGPFGYLCIDFAGEPAYDDIDGEWSSRQAYAVIHRLAFSAHGRGKGASGEAFRLAKELCISRNIRSIRIDTDSRNHGMRHILEREGYEYCGRITFQSERKLAYELDF